jgi:hypothetical protein
MRYAVAFALILTHATPVLAWQAPAPPQPYTRADFEQDCIKMAAQLPEARRAAWIASCRKDAP